MHQSAYARKTLGFENPLWAYVCCRVMIAIYIWQMFIFWSESVWNCNPFWMKYAMLPTRANLTATFHFTGYYTGQLGFIFLFHRLEKAPPRSYPKYYKTTGIAAILIPIYLYNPWIAEYCKDGKQFYDIPKYTFKFQSLTFPFYVLALLVLTWILWRICNKREDWVWSSFEELEVSSRGLYKKTGVFPNDGLLVCSAVLPFASAIASAFFIGIESWYLKNSPSSSDYLVLTIFFISGCLHISMSLQLFPALWNPAKFYISYAKRTAALTICLLIYELNPLTQKWVNDHGTNYKASQKTQFMFVGFSLIGSTIAIWLLWKMAKIQEDWDEPYAVICGEKDSTTKRLIQKIE